MSIETLYQIYLQHPSVQTDTRSLQPGDLFFALKGPSFNGNSFAAKALEAGAAYAIIDEPKYTIPDKTILVENVLETLQALAYYHRQQFDIPFIAITGSNGKTTTKELVSAVLSKKYITYTTKGNLNNHIGVPLTLLSIQRDAAMAVIEMGANHQKEIEGYCKYTAPNFGLITNCGKAHLEGFGGEQGVRKGKGELFDYLRAQHGMAFIMNDYDYLKSMSEGITNRFTYGTADAQVCGQIIASEPFLSFEVNTADGQKMAIHSNLVGSYNLPNMLAAVAVGRYFEVPDALIKEAIETYIPSNSRSQLVKKGTHKIILDAYNANPSSMKLAIENFAQKEGGQKILLLGAMAELGQESLQEHEAIIKLIQQYNWKAVVLVGGDFTNIKHPFINLPDAAAAAAWLQEQHFEHAQFLIKGSRSQQMEKVLMAFD